MPTFLVKTESRNTKFGLIPPPNMKPANTNAAALLLLLFLFAMLQIVLRQSASTPADPSFLNILALLDVSALVMALYWNANPYETEHHMRHILREVPLFGGLFEFLFIDVGLFHAMCVAILLLTPVYLVIFA